MIEKYASEQARSEHLQGAALGLGIGRTARHARPHRSRVEPHRRQSSPRRDLTIYIAACPSGLWVIDFTTGDLLHLAFASAVK